MNLATKRALRWVPLFLFSTALLSAQVSFVFNFTDLNTGFNDATQGATRRAALQSAASYLSSYFVGYPARTVTFDVSSVNSGGFLASATSSASSGANGFQPTLAQRFIQTGTGSGSMGAIQWNFGYSWDYDDLINNGYDFKAVAMHELLHALGITSYLSATGTGGFNRTSGTADLWFTYDRFLSDANGTRLIDNTTFGFNTSLASLLTNNVSGDIYFAGPNAVAANGGQLVRLYSPATFLAGSSITHLDPAVFPTNSYLMAPSISPNVMLRTLSAVELGILADLGYNVSMAAIPEPSTWAALLGLMAIIVTIVWRRRYGPPCVAK